MSTHTQGKLVVSKYRDESGWVDVVVIETNGHESLPFIACKHFDQEANARRLVACWNACEGVPTDVLEQVEGFGNAALPYHKLKAQRDDLLEALVDLVAFYPPNSTDPLITSARAAISKATGQKGGA